MGKYLRYLNQKPSQMGHQEAYGFRCKINKNSHYELQQVAVQMVYFLK